ncbi:OVARIAN TUMOR DOMAIN-containing deubiquitinating enzyme 6, partial [Biomphalaria pfeifferi]
MEHFSMTINELFTITRKGQIQTMSENGCWTTTCELYVAATVLQRELYVFTPHSENTEYKWILIQPVFPHQEMLIGEAK